MYVVENRITHLLIFKRFAVYIIAVFCVFEKFPLGIRANNGRSSYIHGIFPTVSWPYA